MPGVMCKYIGRCPVSRLPCCFISFCTVAFPHSGMRQFVAINAIWARPDSFEWVQRHLTLRHFPGSHTAERTSQLVRKVMQEYGIPEFAFKYACTDNCSTMEACFNHHLTDTTRLFYAPHWMQLVIKDAL